MHSHVGYTYISNGTFFFLIKLEEHTGNKVEGECQSIIVLWTAPGWKGGMVDHLSLPSLNPLFFNLSTSSQYIPSSLHKSKGKMKWGSFPLECQTAFDILLPKRLKVFWQKEFCIQNLWHPSLGPLRLSVRCFLVSCWEGL